MVRERFKLLKALGWPGYMAAVAQMLFALMTIAMALYGLTAENDRLSHWAFFPLIASLLIGILLNVAMEKKRTQ
jgi:hypothetical protein